jgi:conjugative relaxase-like TrwC/TraI family protein
VLNIGKLRKGGELYYLNSVARGVEDYYLGSGEAPGYWLATGAEDLGLTGEVGDNALRALLRGLDPRSGERLANSSRSKRDRVPGFDLTFRAPKSVSLLHALGPKEASNQVVSAHDTAVAAALAYLERHASSSRRGKGGKNKIASKGFIGAAFRHRTSRSGDPLLHTHVLVANIIEGQDGRWGALDARRLYIQAKTAGYLYQAHLRAELTRRLGVEWTPVRNGAADIEGISRKVIRAFSKRRREIESAMGRTGKSSAKAAEMAALATRKAKDYRVSPALLLPEWQGRAERLGLDYETMRSLTGRTAWRLPSADELQRVALELAGPSGLTAQASSFSRREVIQGFCESLQSGAQVEEIERLADTFLVLEFAVPLSPRTDGLTAKESIRVCDGRMVPAQIDERRFSTNEMLVVEEATIERSIERRLDGSGVAAVDEVDRALSKRPTLYTDQQAMVRGLTTSGLGVEVVVGKAGAGKTFALDAAREAWTASGFRTIGCALSARAAQELQSGSGIESFTITKLLNDLDHPQLGGLPTNAVVVVDEAGMVGTRDLARLLTHAERARSKVVLVGDDKQLPEIQAGGAFRGIKNRLPAIELSEVRRQPFGWEREALDLMRQGRSQDAIDAYMAHDRVVIAASSDETRRQLVSDWWDTQNDQNPAVMIAARRSDVADLNERGRALMEAAGKLGTTSLQFGDRHFSIGDRVMTLRNTRGLALVNGTRGVVEEIDLEREELTLTTDFGSRVTLPRSYLEAGHLTHAYAITGHKAQGMTVHKAFVLGDETLYREWAYVAMSRGRKDNRLYVVAGVDPDRQDVGGEIAVPTDPMKELVRAIGRSRAKDLALDTYEHEHIRNMTTGELRKESEQVGVIVEGMPPDISDELRQLRTDENKVEELIRRQRNIQRAAQNDLKGIGVLGRRRNRVRRIALESRITEASEGEAQLLAALDHHRDRIAELQDINRSRDDWLVENAAAIRRFDVLSRELLWREHIRALENRSRSALERVERELVESRARDFGDEPRERSIQL